MAEEGGVKSRVEGDMVLGAVGKRERRYWAPSFNTGEWWALSRNDPVSNNGGSLGTADWNTVQKHFSKPFQGMACTNLPIQGKENRSD